MTVYLLTVNSTFSPFWLHISEFQLHSLGIIAHCINVVCLGHWYEPMTVHYISSSYISSLFYLLFLCVLNFDISSTNYELWLRTVLLFRIWMKQKQIICLTELTLPLPLSDHVVITSHSNLSMWFKSKIYSAVVCHQNLLHQVRARARVRVKPGFHYPSSRPEFMGRVDGPSTRVHFLTPMNSARVDGCQKMHPSWRAVKSARELGPSTRVVDTGL